MIYTYKGFHGCHSQCKLEIIENLVIATEIPENEGTSITSLAAQLATRVCQEFAIMPSHLIWIEHCLDGTPLYPFFDPYQNIYLVSFNLNSDGVFSNPRWTGITSEIVVAFRRTHQYRMKLNEQDYYYAIAEADRLGMTAAQGFQWDHKRLCPKCLEKDFKTPLSVDRRIPIPQEDSDVSVCDLAVRCSVCGHKDCIKFVVTYAPEVYG